MPTSRSKNLLYRLALSFATPSVPSAPVVSVQGNQLLYPKSLERIIRKNHISGAALCLLSGNDCSRIFTKAFHTDLVPDSNTFFRVASITKMATALVAVRLMDQGIIDPDQPVSYLLPDGNTITEIQNITIRHLLSHTSGLYDPPDLENLLNRHKPIRTAVSGRRKNEPGEIFCYSNLGFGLVGCVFEAILNKSVENIFQEYLFQPLGMRATLSGLSISSECIMPVTRILPYHNGKLLTVTELGRFPLNSPEPEYHYGYSAGSMYTDLSSLLKLTACLRDGGYPLISGKYSGWMQQHAADYGRVSPGLSYGYGLLIVHDNRISGSRMFGHQGFAYGCVDGAFWEEDTGRIMISLNGSCSEARTGRFGIANYDLCKWAFGKELPAWK